MADAPVIILGAGMAGLGAADRLRAAGVRYRLIERESAPGGLVRTDQIDAFLFDRAGHFLHARTPFFQQVLRSSGVSFETLNRKSAVILGDAVVPYPLQYNLWAAPKGISSAVRRDLGRLPTSVDAQASFAVIMEQLWGPTLADEFFRPFHRKMWRIPLRELPSEWGAEYVPRRDLRLMEKGLAEPVMNVGYNSTYLYPSSGRIGEFADGLARKHASNLLLNAEVIHIDTVSRRVTLADGRHLNYSTLISSAPLPRLLEMLGWPESVSPLFRCSNLINLRVGFRGSMLRDEHWYYLPDPAVPFFRVGFPCNVAQGVAPPGCQILSLEYGIGESLTVPSSVPQLAERALEYLSRHGVLTWESIEVVDAHLIAPAYVAYRMSTTPELRRLAKGLRRRNILLAGRYGEWDYYAVEQAYRSGWAAAGEHVRAKAEGNRAALQSELQP